MDYNEINKPQSDQSEPTLLFSGLEIEQPQKVNSPIQSKKIPNNLIHSASLNPKKDEEIKKKIGVPESEGEFISSDYDPVNKNASKKRNRNTVSDRHMHDTPENKNKEELKKKGKPEISLKQTYDLLDIETIIQMEDPFTRPNKFGMKSDLNSTSRNYHQIKSIKSIKSNRQSSIVNENYSVRKNSQDSQGANFKNDYENNEITNNNINSIVNIENKNENENNNQNNEKLPILEEAININEEEDEEEEDENNEILKNSGDNDLTKEYIQVDRASFYINGEEADDDDEEEEIYEVEIFDSVWMTILNIINCMIKANLVQIAFSMKELGLIWGPITICTIAIMALISLHMILQVNKLTGQSSYLVFSEMIFGHVGSVFILVCNFMSAYGGCLSFIVIFNKVIPKILNISLGKKFNLSNPFILNTILGAVLLYYCHKKDVSVIKKSAKFAVSGVVLFFILTLIDFVVCIVEHSNKDMFEIEGDKLIHGLNVPSNNNRLGDIITAVACIILSYSFHIFTFSIYGCMGRISRKQFYLTSSVSVLIVTTIYLICGTIGYLLYYDTLNDSILDAIDNSALSTLLSISNLLSVIMTFPVTFAALRNYFLVFSRVVITFTRDFILYMFKSIPKVQQTRERLSQSRISKVLMKKTNINSEKNYLLMTGKPLIKMPIYIEFLLVVALLASIFVYASYYDKLKVIFSFTGGVMGNILSFIFPSLFYLGFSGRSRWFTKFGIFAFIFIILGCITMGICIKSTLQSVTK